MFNAFNIANHQNVTSMNTTAYALSGTTATYQTNYGLVTNSNSQGFLYTPRELEFSIRINF
jgi:hypothetical protein